MHPLPWKAVIPVLVAVLLAGCNSKPALQQDFAFHSFDSAQHKLSDYAGKPIVLNFWADW